MQNRLSAQQNWFFSQKIQWNVYFLILHWTLRGDLISISTEIWYEKSKNIHSITIRQDPSSQWHRNQTEMSNFTQFSFFFRLQSDLLMTSLYCCQFSWNLIKICTKFELKLDFGVLTYCLKERFDLYVQVLTTLIWLMFKKLCTSLNLPLWRKLGLDLKP